MLLYYVRVVCHLTTVLFALFNYHPCDDKVIYPILALHLNKTQQVAEKLLELIYMKKFFHTSNSVIKNLTNYLHCPLSLTFLWIDSLNFYFIELIIYVTLYF